MTTRVQGTCDINPIINTRTLELLRTILASESPLKMGGKGKFDPSKDLVDLKGKVVIVSGGK